MSKINEEDIDLTRSLIHRSEVNLNCVDSDISGTGGSCFYEVKAVDTSLQIDIFKIFAEIRHEQKMTHDPDGDTVRPPPRLHHILVHDVVSS